MFKIRFRKCYLQNFKLKVLEITYTKTAYSVLIHDFDAQNTNLRTLLLLLFWGYFCKFHPLKSHKLKYQSKKKTDHFVSLYSSVCVISLLVKIGVFGESLVHSVKYLESVEQMSKVGYNASPICSNVHDHIDPERSLKANSRPGHL